MGGRGRKCRESVGRSKRKANRIKVKMKEEARSVNGERRVEVEMRRKVEDG